jgi:hypothetical protein
MKVKKRAKLSLGQIEKSQKLGVKKITLQDLDEPKLNNVAGGCTFTLLRLLNQPIK